jgi:hypothetical protein
MPDRPDLLHGQSRHDAKCNCPPLRDVFREGVGSKPPCPVHPDSPALSDLLKPRIYVDDGEFQTFVTNDPARDL